MKPHQSEHTESQIVGEDLLVLNREKNEVHHLNPTAFWVFQRCDGHTTIEMIIESMTQHFDVDQTTAAQDTKQVIAELEKLSLIVRDHA